MKRVSDCNVGFYFNSQFKKYSQMVSQITYKNRENNFIECSIDSENEVTNDNVPWTPQGGDVVVVKYERKQKKENSKIFKIFYGGTFLDGG